MTKPEGTEERVAKVTQEFEGAADGEAYAKTRKVGAFIRGELAEAEVANGRAEWTTPEKRETKEAGKAAAGPLDSAAGGKEKPPSSPRAGRANAGKTSSTRKKKAT